MKRIFTCCLMMLLVLSLAGCGSSEDSETKEEAAESETEDETGAAETYEEEPDDRNWSDSEIASFLAVPDSDNIEILEDTDDYFSFKVDDATRDDYETYVGACQYIGFSEDVSETEDSFEAASDDGYRISITYDEAEDSYGGSIEPR